MTSLARDEPAWHFPKIPVAILLVSWALFCLGAAFEYRQRQSTNIPIIAFTLLAAAPALLLRLLSDTRKLWAPRVARHLDDHSEFIDSLPAAKLWLWIALAAGLGLYFELVIIRFHASCFQLFAFFKNVSLLSCFLGLGIGYCITSKRLLTPLVIPLMAAQLIVLHSLRFTNVSDFLQNPVSETWDLGLEQAGDWAHMATSYGFLISIFVFNAFCFVPLGHLASRLMSRSQRLPAYSWNLLGSLIGIGLFYLLSFLWTPPVIWVGLAILMTLPFLKGRFMASALAAAILLPTLGSNLEVSTHDIYTPYQILTVTDSKIPHPSVEVNHIYYQKILDLSPPAVAADPDLLPASVYYGLPYLLKPNPENVLIVGSGTGNDVASAIRHRAGHVDAVEIDPGILDLGQKLHPESPYQSSLVTAHVQDARAFIRYSPGKYDLIVYGLLDSHTLLSGVSGVRLDSYIYTAEAIREARAHLKPGGLICLSFCMIKGELGRKLFLMIQNAFDGKEPIVYETGYDGGFTFVIGDQMPKISASALPSGISIVTDWFTGEKFHADMSTDDWPFFYMPVRKYPMSYVIMIVILLAVAITFIRPTVAASGRGFSAPCFFLGAGFMLLETKAVTELALFYGSTWVVTGIVITAILILAFLANLLLMAVNRIPRPLVYILLLATIALSLFISGSSTWISTGPWTARTLMTGVLTLPLFFAGLAFSSELKHAKSIGIALGDNLIGAMVGGCLEYNSMYFGYRSLYFLAMAIYALALAASMTSRASTRIDTI